MPHEKRLERHTIATSSFERQAAAAHAFHVEFPKVALLAHGKRTRPKWTAAATATAETCSRDLFSTCRLG
jgi:hypothetical protein